MTVRTWTNKVIPDLETLAQALFQQDVTELEIGSSLVHDNDTGDGSVDTVQTQTKVDTAVTTTVAGTTIKAAGMDNRTSNQTLTKEDGFQTHRAKGQSADISFTLPVMRSCREGWWVRIINLDSAKDVTVVGLATTPRLTTGQEIELIWDGVAWSYLITTRTIVAVA